MKTNPEMNAEIVRILRVGEEPHLMYAALRIEELEAIVKKLQVTADGVPVTEPDIVWHPRHRDPFLVRKIASLTSFDVSDCYSTSELAAAAREKP